MLDRLEELNRLIESVQPYQPPLLSEGPNSYYIEKIKLAQQSLYKVKKATFQIQELKKTFAKTAFADEESVLKKKLRDLVDFNNREINKVRQISENLADELKDSEIDSVEFRLKGTMQATLMKQFQNTIAESEKAQNTFNDYAKVKISEQLRMIDERIDDETIENCIKNPKLAQEIVESQLIGGHTEVITMVNRIEDRLEDIKMLQENIVIMHKMFLDLANLVENQGELLNSIEAHVDLARDYVMQGTQAIEKAEVQFKRARSKKCCVLIIVLVVGLIIAVPILAVKYF